MSSSFHLTSLYCCVAKKQVNHKIDFYLLINILQMHTNMLRGWFRLVGRVSKEEMGKVFTCIVVLFKYSGEKNKNNPKTISSLRE